MTSIGGVCTCVFGRRNQRGDKYQLHIENALIRLHPEMWHVQHPHLQVRRRSVGNLVTTMRARSVYLSRCSEDLAERN